MTAKSFLNCENPFPNAYSSHIYAWPRKVQQNHITLNNLCCFLFIFLTRYQTKQQTIDHICHFSSWWWKYASFGDVFFCLPAHVMSWQKKHYIRYEVNIEEKQVFVFAVTLTGNIEQLEQSRHRCVNMYDVEEKKKCFIIYCHCHHVLHILHIPFFFLFMVQMGGGQTSQRRNDDEWWLHGKIFIWCVKKKCNLVLNMACEMDGFLAIGNGRWGFFCDWSNNLFFVGWKAIFVNPKTSSNVVILVTVWTLKNTSLKPQATTFHSPYKIPQQLQKKVTTLSSWEFQTIYLSYSNNSTVARCSFIVYSYPFT